MGSILVCCLLLVLAVTALYDLTQRKHAILRNFPIVGHARYWIETIGPELRQYIVAANDEERPFNRDERSWVYASAKRKNNYFGFGTDNDLERSPNYLVIKQSAFPIDSPHAGQSGHDPMYPIPCAKIVGGHRQRPKAFRPPSVVNVSGMSFGSLSGRAVEALSRGCAAASCLQNTGEGGISPYHLRGGAELIWQIGTGYFGCRTPQGTFCIDRFAETVARHEMVRAIEIKLSQGAKPGHGGVLPRRKISAEIAAIRGIPRDRDCVSPARHTAFSCVDSLLDFIERLAERSQLPIGIKSAVGELPFWVELARRVATEERSVDFITIDGGEGGTGAAPRAFADHVALPFKTGFARVYSIFAEAGAHERVVFAGSAKLGFPEAALLAFALGCDMIQIARTPMLAIGCIQAQKCHTNHCPTGVATQNKWFTRGLDPFDKGSRATNYLIALRKEILDLSHACGVVHPAFITGDQIDILDDRYHASSLRETFGYAPNWGLPGSHDLQKIEQIMGDGHATAS